MKTRLLFCCLLLLLLIGCTTMDAVTGQQTTNMYTLQQDVEIGAQVFNSTVEEMQSRGIAVNADHKRLAQLQEMVDRIAASSNLPDLPYEVALIQTNVVNAMAAPGGKIMVYEGLWDSEEGLAQDEDEIAAVIAHEIAHVNARHSTEAMTRQLLPNMIFLGATVFAQAKEKEDMARVLGGAFILYNGIWVTRYSRQDEMEADAVGLMYMARAGYDPRAAVRIWERAENKRTGYDPADSIFSTHPSSVQRIQNLRSRLPAALSVYESAVEGRAL